MSASTGPSKARQAELYKQAMGGDALARQTVMARTKDIRIRCKCSQSSTPRAEEPGPYHRSSCPLYTPAI